MYGVSLHWIPRIIATFGGFPFVVAVLITGSLFLLSSLQFALAHFLVRRLDSGWIKSWRLSLPLAWLAAEVLWPQFIPWRLGDSLLGLPWIASGASLLGTSFLSFLLLWWSAVAITKPAAKVRNSAVASVAFLLVFGFFRTTSYEAAIKTAPSIRILAVQGNLDPLRDFRTESLNSNLLRYRSLTVNALKTFKADIVIWPESSVGFDYFVGEKSITRGTNRDPLPGLNTPLVFGGQLRRREQVGMRPQYYNSIIALAPDGKVVGTYRKQRLFPFSETQPLWGLVPRIFERPYDLLSGAHEKAIVIPLTESSVTLASAICFEDLYPEVLRNLSSDSNLLLAVSNDNWFLDSIASRQHHRLASMRALELGRGLLRVTNSGVTAFVNSLGQTVNSLDQFTADTLKVTVSLSTICSLYSFTGNFPVYLIVFFTFVISGAKRRR